MRRPVTNIAASIRQRLLNEAKRRDESFDYVLSLYVRERFLARLAASPHRARLVLKGASVLGLWIEVRRTTRDLDFLGRGNFDPREAERIVREICETAVENDGLKFDSASVIAEPIREADEYRGARVHVEATLDGARIRVQIDIGIGDVITPPAVVKELPSILGDFAPRRVKVYPPETIVAEKLHALTKLGIANSRMKDFFDLYALARSREFDETLLAAAVARTFKRRKTIVPEEPVGLTMAFYADRLKQASGEHS
jgi:predicted nucleotidyltransferase component of viral defense system